jgi:hypothetical protein
VPAGKTRVGLWNAGVVMMVMREYLVGHVYRYCMCVARFAEARRVRPVVVDWGGRVKVEVCVGGGVVWCGTVRSRVWNLSIIPWDRDIHWAFPR